MEGVLQKLEIQYGKIYNTEDWQPYYFTLKGHILQFSKIENKSQIIGKFHMEITKILPNQDQDNECEIRIHSGLYESKLRALSVKEKIEWRNAINQAQKLFKKNNQNNQIRLQQDNAESLQNTDQKSVSNNFSFDLQRRNPTIFSPTYQNFDVESDLSSQQSKAASEIIWTDFLNLSFNTKIFSLKQEYMFELENIDGAKQKIHEALSDLVPSLQIYMQLASKIKFFQESVDLMKYSTDKCVQIMEKQRKQIYEVSKKVMQIKEKLQQDLEWRDTKRSSNLNDNCSIFNGLEYNKNKFENFKIIINEKNGLHVQQFKTPEGLKISRNSFVDGSQRQVLQNGNQKSSKIKVEQQKSLRQLNGDQQFEIAEIDPETGEVQTRDSQKFQQTVLLTENDQFFDFEDQDQFHDLEDEQPNIVKQQEQVIINQSQISNLNRQKVSQQNQISINSSHSFKKQAIPIQKPDFVNFMGSAAFVKVKLNNSSRDKLPFLRPENEVIGIWSLISKFIGQDLTKISLPVILSEPLSTLQKCAEAVNVQEDIVQKAAKTNDSLKRLALSVSHYISSMSGNKNRTKKPFNPVLGETYELVTEDFRFVSEQVSHHPPISAYFQQGKGYEISGFLHTKSKFGIGGGRGQMNVIQLGYTDYFYKDYDEVISVKKPTALACNLVLGQVYIDFEGTVDAINHNTNEKAIINFQPRGWTTSSLLTGSIFDSNGIEVYKLEGSWLDKVYMVSCQTQQKELILESLEEIEDSKKMFNFGILAVNLNYKCQEMEEIVPPTDSRFRGDQRFLEEGMVDQADEEKVRIEVKQRKQRKEWHDENFEWQPLYFKEVPHKFIDGEISYDFIQNNNYWERRQKKQQSYFQQ